MCRMRDRLIFGSALLLLLLVALGNHGGEAAPWFRKSVDQKLDRQLARFAKLLLNLSAKSSSPDSSLDNSVRDITSVGVDEAAGSKDPEAWPGLNPHEACEAVIIKDYRKQNRRKRKQADFKSLPTCGLNMFMMAKLREDKRSGARAEALSGAGTALDRLRALLGLGGAVKRQDVRIRSKTLIKKKDIEERIVGGQPSARGRFPWMVAVGIKGMRLFCGAALISDQWILSAAHCFKIITSPCMLNIRVGATDWREDGTGHHVDQTPEYVITHPEYDPVTFHNDISLIKLPLPVPLSPDSFINPVCVPNQSFPPGAECIAAGWGTTVEGNVSTAPDSYEQVTLKVQPQTNCKFNVTTKQFCAGHMAGGVDTCQGDSGGPLVCKRDGQWQQFGVTSYGNGCGHPGYPGIYTDVSKYWDFIQDVIARF